MNTNKPSPSSNRHKWVVGLIIFALLPLAAYAQQEVLVTGQDDAGITRPALVDSLGRLITTTTNSSGSGATSTSANTYAPDPTTTSLDGQASGCTTVGDADCTNIFPATNLQAWPRITIWVTTGGQVLDDCLVEWSYDGVNWELWDPNTFDAQPASTTRTIAIDGNSRKWLRIEARSATAQDVKVAITASQG